ncbi:rhamnan synthesis F family protein [Microbacterium sp. 18062]|uniref:rhamnan synthesis F family protein n=1 Tax=Microbacterium sp. 18062 TaxID=2681410 RepID=UPI001356B48B|nr:rhamnan synthesis F family protein [Microbacterium sp. 18062]
MKRLAVVAHFDSRGGAAEYFLRQLEEIGQVYDDVVVASSASLTDSAISSITERATLLRRPNFGHDFGSWRDALERLGWAADYDELLLTNDSYVGFFTPLADVIAEMSRQPVEVWGMTMTHRLGLHIQSYFLHFTSPALHSQAFRRFWMDARPAPDRLSAIALQEVGLGAAMRAAGFTIGSYFTPTVAERLRANARGAHWLYRRQRSFPARYDSLHDDDFTARRLLRPDESDRLNTSSAFADSTLDDGRLPVIKLDVLRNDPFWLGSDVLLRSLRRSYPTQMAGVEEHIWQMREDYAPRPYENHAPTRLAPPLRLALGYRRPLPLLHRPRRPRDHEFYADFPGSQNRTDS